MVYVHKPVPPFVVMPMPLNKDGEGPATGDEEVVKMTWEVWDSEYITLSTWNSEEKANESKAALERLYPS